MENERKQWQGKLKEKLSELIEPAKAIHELMKEHPDNSFLLEDVKQVLKGNDGARSYIPANEGLELLRLYELLQWIK